MEDKIRPGRWLYAVSAAILVFGVVGFILLLISGINKSMDKLDNRIIVPGKSVIELNESGKYNIYFEYKSELDGQIYSNKNLNGLTCIITNLDSGVEITLKNPKIDMNYNLINRSGYNIYEFIIDSPGRYELNSWYPSGEGDKAVLVIEQGFAETLTINILLCLASLFLGIGGGVIIFVITLFMRNRAKKSKEI